MRGRRLRVPVRGGLPRTHFTSRMRRDAALYQPAPPRTGKRGRPRYQRRPAAHPSRTGQHRANKDGRRRGRPCSGATPLQRLVLVRDVLWYAVNKRDLLRLVIVRDPAGAEPDDFFVTTDLPASGARHRVPLRRPLVD